MHHAWSMTHNLFSASCTSTTLWRPAASFLRASLKGRLGQSASQASRLQRSGYRTNARTHANANGQSRPSSSLVHRPALSLCERCLRFSSSRRGFSTSRLRHRRFLPEDYDPVAGVSFRQKDLSQFEINKIFGPGVSPDTGNHILKVQHGRRLAGTIFDDTWTPPVTGFSERAASKALNWLRKNYPVNEQAAYHARVRAEESEHEQDVVADAERIGIWHPQQGAQGDPHYGRGVLDEMREQRQRREEELEKNRKEQEKEIQQNTGTLKRAEEAGKVAHTEPPQWLEYYRKRGTITDATSPPEMSTARRIIPSLVVVVGTILVSFFFSTLYNPPSRSARLWPDIPPAAATILGIILLNSLVLVAWRLPPLYRLLNKYFIQVPGYPFAMSTLGNTFSHQQVKHFATNMAILWFIGTKLHDSLNRADFLTIYLAGGVIGSFFSLAGHVLRNNLIVASLGASGAVCGVVGAWFWMNIDRSFRPIFLPTSPSSATEPVSSSYTSWTIPSYVLLTFLISVEVIGIKRRWGNVDNLAHLGGYVGGIGTFIGLGYVNSDRGKKRRRFVEARR